jgi:hypothetical protein
MSTHVLHAHNKQKQKRKKTGQRRWKPMETDDE